MLHNLYAHTIFVAPAFRGLSDLVMGEICFALLPCSYHLHAT
jgi:hypothetical protein